MAKKKTKKTNTYGKRVNKKKTKVKDPTPMTDAQKAVADTADENRTAKEARLFEEGAKD